MFAHLENRSRMYSTGVPWLPTAPREWTKSRLKWLMQESTELVGESWSSTPLLALTKAGVVARDINNLHGKIPASFAGYQFVAQCDLVFCLFDIDETPCTVGMATRRGMITAAYTRFVTLGGAEPRYLELLFRSLDTRKLLRPLYRGLRKSIGAADLLATWVPLPPLNEQRAIITFLAHAQKRINEAILARRRLIALLEEQKKVVVHEAVSGAMVGSARTLPLKRVVVDTRAGVWGAEPGAGGSDARPVLCVRVADFDYALASVSSKASTLRAVGEADLMTRSLREGDLLIEASGGGALTPVGRVVRYALGHEAVCSNFVIRTRPRADIIDGEFLMHILRDWHATDKVRHMIKQTTGIQNLDLDEYFACHVPVPPMDLQKQAVLTIARQVSATDDAIRLAERELDLLNEFSIRLTSDVVTGQLDVRAIASKLPPVDPSEEFVPDLAAIGEDDENAVVDRMEEE